ncbi:helix-turn-helix domain-containing protein [Leptolyngbyaceae cyanobacterium UHCC 1019]
MKNKIKEFIESRGITVYQFRQETGIANKTAYDLVNKPQQYPGREVMDKICSTYRVQPSELLEWIEE